MYWKEYKVHYNETRREIKLNRMYVKRDASSGTVMIIVITVIEYVIHVWS